jgi:hypothetical protein
MVLDFNGGTYISQISAESPKAALTEWVNIISKNGLEGCELSSAEMASLDEEIPVPLDHCLNAWCVTGSAKTGLILLNIIATVPV